MKINDEVIRHFLINKNLEAYRNYWIYNKIVPGSYTFEEPEKISLETLRTLHELTVHEIKHFEPVNLALWEQLFKMDEIPTDLLIYLIVGSPYPYDAMVRRDESGQSVIIFDLIRINSYSDDFDKLIQIIKEFLTHEISHVFLHNHYPYLENQELTKTFLQLIFDEGIAHFISHQEDVLMIDWESEQMQRRKRTAYQQINEYLSQPEILTEEVLTVSNCGPFWEKFVAIGGMFAVYDYYQYHGHLNTLIDEGPNALLPFIKNKSK